MFVTIILLGVLLVGLILLILGAVLLIKAKNKILGLALMAVGFIFILIDIAIFLALIISTRSMG